MDNNNNNEEGNQKPSPKIISMAKHIKSSAMEAASSLPPEKEYSIKMKNGDSLKVAGIVSVVGPIFSIFTEDEGTLFLCELNLLEYAVDAKIVG